jgi:hypothetical protein
MDFQGQGQTTTGETEALAIIDSFTKTVAVIALPSHEAHTLAPRLLDEIFFRRSAPRCHPHRRCTRVGPHGCHIGRDQNLAHDNLQAQRPKQRRDRELVAVLEPHHEISVCSI